MRGKVIRNAGSNWRPYRFPPRCSSPLPDDGDPASMQRAMADGFQQGIEKGYQDGLQQGREAGHREGFDKGRQEGLRQGREEGRQQGRQIFEEASRPLERISEQLREFLAGYELRRRQELLELVQKVAKQVIRVELTLNPAQLLTLAEEALAAMPAEGNDVQILLNPEECARIRDLVPERAAAWRLVPDERLALGECRVVTAQAEADIGCQQRLDSCMETLASHLLPSEA
ncbi:flagellar assembly protein FliH [Zestomonas thermotolerans]|uniref:flagellar assembly protein FliH n=1 Tax=Zestomonas thermotolerans TaxID=157784 RepID=UPI000374A081|nr:flagellar assembly protein FliH [Pseudomonas thermotolerans]MBO2510656.1 flagellar assembly protein FliH [Gammaproteobacteria bacterium]